MSFDHDPSREPFGSLSGPPSNSWRFSSTANAGTTEEVGLVWAKLCSGQLRIVRHVLGDFRTTLHLEERRADNPSRWAIRGRSMVILQRVLMGQSLNFISLDLALSSSTVSAEFQFTMRALELKPRLSCLPMYLPQLWHASRARPDSDGVRREDLQLVRYATISLPRPELRLSSMLTRAELEVTSLFLQGKTHAEIAAARGTSMRTTANQLASVFTKLKVSGRLELVTSLAQGCVH